MGCFLYLKNAVMHAFRSNTNTEKNIHKTKGKEVRYVNRKNLIKKTSPIMLGNTTSRYTNRGDKKFIKNANQSNPWQGSEIALYRQMKLKTRGNESNEMED